MTYFEDDSMADVERNGQDMPQSSPKSNFDIVYTFLMK